MPGTRCQAAAYFGSRLADSLEARGLLENAIVVVTSDHGEEFFEHGHRYHGAPHHEEKMRVPLFLHGPGLEAGDRTVGVSHIDFAPGIAALAGVPAPPAWEGRPWLDLEDERLIFAHHGVAGQHPFVTVVEGTRKVYAAEGDALNRGEVLAAYDLSEDPVESLARTADTAPWSVDLSRRAGSLWDRLRLPLARTMSIELDADARKDLQDLGYVE